MLHHQTRAMTILGLGFMLFIFGMTWLFTRPETNTTTIHKSQDRLQLPCPQGANE